MKKNVTVSVKQATNKIKRERKKKRKAQLESNYSIV